MKINIKALGSSLGRVIPGHKPNVGKNPKDGDGDGFVVDLLTGLDNVPFEKPGRIGQYVSEETIREDKRRNRENFRRLVPDAESLLRNANEASKFEIKPKPAKPNTKENIFDDTDTETIFNDLNKSQTFIKKLRDALHGEKKPPRGFQRGSGQTEEAHRDQLNSTLKTQLDRMKQMQEALKRRGYEDAELARLAYNKSKRQGKSISEFLIIDNASLNIFIDDSIEEN